MSQVTRIVLWGCSFNVFVFVIVFVFVFVFVFGQVMSSHHSDQMFLRVTSLWGHSVVMFSKRSLTHLLTQRVTRSPNALSSEQLKNATISFFWFMVHIRLFFWIFSIIRASTYDFFMSHCDAQYRSEEITFSRPYNIFVGKDLYSICLWSWFSCLIFFD